MMIFLMPNPHFQAISWTDPREEEERRRLKAKLAAETQAIGLLASTSKVGNSAAADATDQMASMEVPENLTDVMMGGSDEKENAPDRDGVKRKLSLNSNSSGRACHRRICIGFW